MGRMYNQNNKQLARQLRSNMTKEEKTLWYKGIHYDNKRTKELMEYGIKAVIRIPNNEINYNLAGVVDFIEEYIDRTLSQP